MKREVQLARKVSCIRNTLQRINNQHNIITKAESEIEQGCTNIPKIYSHLKILDDSWMT